MTFGEAIEEMRCGTRMTRKGWNGEGMYTALQTPDEHSKMSLPYMYMCTVTGELIPWVISHSDALSNDWVTA